MEFLVWLNIFGLMLALCWYSLRGKCPHCYAYRVAIRKGPGETGGNYFYRCRHCTAQWIGGDCRYFVDGREHTTHNDAHGAGLWDTWGGLKVRRAKAVEIVTENLVGRRVKKITGAEGVRGRVRAVYVRPEGSRYGDIDDDRPARLLVESDDGWLYDVPARRVQMLPPGEKDEAEVPF